MWRNYHAAVSIEHALQLLEQHGSRARVIAGGTDILIELERKIRPDVDTLIDISRVPGLDGIALDVKGMLRLGPLVTHNRCAASAVIREQALPLARACWEVGAPQIRNRGTVAGNLITASPANDTITPLMAMDAAVTLRSVDGERVLPLSQFYRGVRSTDLRPNELLTEISFPALQADERGMFIKLGLRRAQAIAVVNVAVIIRVGPGEPEAVCSRARIALGAVAPRIIRATEAEQFLRGEPLHAGEVERAARLAAQAARPIDDVRGSAGYRREMVRVLTGRALRAIGTGENQGELPDNPVLLCANAPDHPGPPLHAAWADGENGSAAPIATTVNGDTHSVRGAERKSLLRMLREDLGLIGTKEGCNEGECGACTVHLDGAAVMSCLVPAPRAHGADILTVEGLACDGKLHPLQQAFIKAGAVQCGYCTPGLLMAGAKLLQERPQPTLREAQQAITGNLCRCTGYYKVLDALQQSYAPGSKVANA